MKLSEAARIRNLNTQETTVIDDEGTIADGIGGEPGAEADPTFDFFGDAEGGDTSHLTPSGESDGLDDLFAAISGELGEPPVDGEGPVKGDMEGELEAQAAQEGEFAPLEGEEGLLDDAGLEGEVEDPDFQGVIRTVQGAALIYKRRTEDGVFEELWCYNVGKNMKQEAKIRRGILAGTDVGPQQTSSEDGSQTIETSSIGNVQFLKIVGLPN